MRDFNYFDPYLNVQVKKNTGMIIIVVLAALMLVLMIYYQILLVQKESSLTTDIAEIESYIQSAEISKKLNDVDIKGKQLENLQTLLGEVSTLNVQLDASSRIDDMLIEQINAQLPQGAFLTEMNLSSNLISIKGYSTEYQTIAQFAYNLRQSDGQYDVLIPSIIENNGNYEFLINITLGTEVSNAN
ncbi:MAG: hypothetical protein BGO41_05480 [Clostridiales bacterium 38-18]|nr:MAG: hypothetical protein BGO41_05480 [Clostridiales bacterium 38-18]